MKKKEKEIVSTLTFAVFIAVIGVFFVLNRVITPPEISQSERRPLATMPEFTLESVTTGKFMDEFDDFAADSFAFRDKFRTIRAETVFYVLFQTDKSGLYLGKSGAGKFERVNESSVTQVAKKIKKVADTLVGLNVRYSFVPDKSIYAGKTLPGFNPALAERLLKSELGAYTFIDLTAALNAFSFYRTDLHWNQSWIKPVAEAITGQTLDFSAYEVKTPGEFQGVYAGQLALPIVWHELLDYYDNPDLKASYLNEKTLQMEGGAVYDTEAFHGRDPYDIFLKGPQALITLENPNAATDRELYLFRDSFSSSLSPLLASHYAKITLIDLRYMDSRMLPQLVEFTPGSDALFLYSSQILNNSTVLLVQ
ncbi:hypothetical protein FACS1894208_12710 [Clostridia bacterium]|nr:hypothetical protein FACS1894208_12710 [Clostridia bacterium]